MTAVCHFDGILPATGPGAEGAAMMLARSGRDVAAAEKYRNVGGGCTPRPFAESSFIQPTMAGHRVAALNGLNRIF